MRRCVLLLLPILLAGKLALASEPSPAFVERFADVIWEIEGGTRARVPYGILSMPIRDRAHGRAVTVQSIRNSWARWERAGRPGDFITFFGSRWAPPTDARNRSWVGNAKKRLKAEGP